METFNYLFAILLREEIFAHSDNLSETIQKEELIDITGKILANHTLKTLQVTCIGAIDHLLLFIAFLLRRKKHSEKILVIQF